MGNQSRLFIFEVSSQMFQQHHGEFYPKISGNSFVQSASNGTCNTVQKPTRYENKFQQQQTCRAEQVW